MGIERYGKTDDYYDSCTAFVITRSLGGAFVAFHRIYIDIKSLTTMSCTVLIEIPSMITSKLLRLLYIGNR